VSVLALVCRVATSFYGPLFGTYLPFTGGLWLSRVWVFRWGETYFDRCLLSRYVSQPAHYTRRQKSPRLPGALFLYRVVL
jgi:hypothetical protein